MPLLAGLSEPARVTLATAFDVEQYPQDHVLVREGRHGYAFYVLREGTAAVAVEGSPVRTLEPGSFFGEIAILGQGRRTATVTTLSPVTVWVLFGTSFRVLTRDNPDVASALENAMRERLAMS